MKVPPSPPPSSSPPPPPFEGNLLLTNSFLFLLDDCRKIEFKDQMHHKALINHVIRIYHRVDIDACELNCFLEPNCRSYNYGESVDGLFVCELSDVHHSQASDGELEARVGFKYVVINEVNLI